MNPRDRVMRRLAGLRTAGVVGSLLASRPGYGIDFVPPPPPDCDTVDVPGWRVVAWASWNQAGLLELSWSVNLSKISTTGPIVKGATVVSDVEHVLTLAPDPGAPQVIVAIDVTCEDGTQATRHVVVTFDPSAPTTGAPLVTAE